MATSLHPAAAASQERPGAGEAGRHAVLDVVRALAAVSVLLTHAGNPLVEPSWGHVALDAYHAFQSWTVWANGGLHGAVVVFIVLSGFCIHMAVAKRGIGSFRLRRYAIRRAVRIYPVLLVAMALGLAVEWWSGHRAVGALALNALQNATLVTGLVPLEAPFGNEILLTVIVECVLYAFYPLGLALVRRQGWRAVFAVASLVYAANVLVLLLAHLDPTWSQRSLWALLLYWWMGAYAAEVAFSDTSRAPSQAPTWPATITAAVLFVLVANVGNRLLHVRGFHLLASPMLALVTALFLAASIRRPVAVPAPVALKRLLTYVGDRSYSLYVVHWPVLTLLLAPAAVVSGPRYVGVLSAVALACVVAYEAVESPTHKLAVRLGGR